MTGTRFAHLVRGLLVALALLFAVSQLGLLTDVPERRLVEILLPIQVLGR